MDSPAHASRPHLCLGVDIGGTFTDVALDVGARIVSTKVLTTHEAPEEAVIDGIGKVLAGESLDFADLSLVIHGTTLATNALIERRGARTAFLTTRGFRDVIEIRNENRFEQYDLNLVLPPPLIEREHRYVAGGRIAASGRELEALDEAAVEAFAERVVEAGYEAVAIGFLHSYVNPAHEARAAEIVAARAPDVALSISSAVSPQMREFERFNTVCSNAYVKPVMARYLRRLERRLKDAGASCPLFLMHSGGGLITVETAIDYPVRLLESGPAGGAIYAADIAARHGLDRVLSFDMGGTTAKICLIEDRTPKTARSFEVARTYRFKKGSGMPISIPVIEMVEIGAGGGSVARVDAMKQIRVGPESAGSEPGPACYGRGGDRPTVTDADLKLGKIDPDGFAGGSIALDAEATEAALSSAVAGPLAINSATAAIGVTEVVDETMANAARVHAVENGKDLSDFTMIAFGGAAPLHAARLADKLGIDRLLIPPGAGVGSAIGFLRAPFSYEAVRGGYGRLSDFDAEGTNRLLGDLYDEARAVVAAGGTVGGPADLMVERKAFMRYAGQGWEIPVELPDGAFGPSGADELRERFEAEYRRLFARALKGPDIEILNWSVRVASQTVPADRLAAMDIGRPAPASGERRLFDPAAQEFVTAGEVERSAFAPGMAVAGPAVVTERETTSLVPIGFTAVMQADGSLLIAREAQG